MNNIKTYQILIGVNILFRLFSYITKQMSAYGDLFDHVARFSSGLFVISVAGGVGYLISMLITNLSVSDANKRSRLNLNTAMTIALIANILIYLGA